MHDFEVKKRQILDRVDILALVSEHVALRRTGKRWVGLCPFHAEKTPSFTVSPDLGVFKCFGCGKGGDIFTFVATRENIPFIEAMRLLADRAAVELDAPVPGRRSGSISRAEIARACAWAQGYFRATLNSPKGAAAREYILGRGFEASVVERFQIGLALDDGPSLWDAAARAGLSPALLEAADLIRLSDDGRRYDTFRNRLIFPIRDATARVIGFGGRTLVDDKAKYLNTRQNELFDKGRNLFGIDLARQSIVERDRAIIVEGYTDCMACHQAGFTEAVASLGTALTEAHVDLLRRYAVEIVLVFDSDQAGIDAAERALRLAISRGVMVRLARVPEGKDPGEFLTGPHAAARFTDLLKAAPEALEFTWRQTAVRYQADGSDARRREAILDFVRVVCEAVRAQAVDAIQKGLLVNQLAHLLQLDRAEVSKLMAAHQKGSISAPPRLVPLKPQAGPGASDADQRAWAPILEVLLNEPGLIGSLGEWPEVLQISDPRLRAIATWVLESVREFGEFTLADVLARCPDSEHAALVAELAARGQARGNYVGTLQAAWQRLQDGTEAQRLDEIRKRILQSSPGPGGKDEEDLAEYADAVRRHRHFGPRRMIRQAQASEVISNKAAQDVQSITKSESI